MSVIFFIFLASSDRRFCSRRAMFSAPLSFRFPTLLFVFSDILIITTRSAVGFNLMIVTIKSAQIKAAEFAFYTTLSPLLLHGDIISGALGTPIASLSVHLHNKWVVLLYSVHVGIMHYYLFTLTLTHILSWFYYNLVCESPDCGALFFLNTILCRKSASQF